MNRGPPKNKISQWNGVEIVPRTMSLQEYLDQRLLGSDGTAFTNVKCNDEQENMVRPETRSCPKWAELSTTRNTTSKCLTKSLSLFPWPLGQNSVNSEIIGLDAFFSLIC